jgi:hypothetical protein
MALEVGSKAGLQDPDKVFEEFFQVAAAQQAAGGESVVPAPVTAVPAPQQLVLGALAFPAAAAPAMPSPVLGPVQVIVPAQMPVVDLGNLFG